MEPEIDLKNLQESTCKILNSFDYLKRMLSERGECSSDRIVIYDDPLTIEITRDRITFCIGEEEHGVLSRDYVHLSEEVKFEVISWIKGLSSLRFKRYTLRKK